MKTLVALAITLFACPSFAWIQCTVPTQAIKFLKIQNLTVDIFDGYKMFSPKQSDCERVDERDIECKFEFQNSKYDLRVDVDLAYSNDYKEAGSITKYVTFFYKRSYELDCRVSERKE
jgi:hypothetical protein